MTDRKAQIAIYSKTMNPGILDEISELLTKKGQDITIDFEIEKLKDKFLLISVKNIGEANNFVKTLCGEELEDNTPILCSVINTTNADEIFDFLWDTMPSRIYNFKNDSLMLDLGYIKSITSAPMDSLGVGSFILLIAAVFCFENETRKKITRMSLANNGIAMGYFLSSIHALFPKIKKIAIFGNPISSRPEKIHIPGKIKIISKREELDFELPEPGQPEPPIQFKVYPIFRPPDPRLTHLGDPELRGRIDLPEMSEFTPCGIDPDEFPTNPLILTFLQTSWDDIASIGKLYHTNAKFSITAKDGGPGSALERYHTYSRDMLTNPGNCVIGQENIVEAQKELFIQGFYAYPLQIESFMLDDCLYSVVIHGVFQDPYMKKQENRKEDKTYLSNVVLMFDRTLVISQSNLAKYVITNDHLYIHNLVVE